MYYEIIESYLRYPNVFWSSLSNTKLAALQRLQDRAFSRIATARFKNSWLTSWSNVENLFRNDRDIMAYKILNKISNSLYIRLNMLKMLHYTALKRSNDTPTEICGLTTLDRFKSNSKRI